MPEAMDNRQFALQKAIEVHRPITSNTIGVVKADADEILSTAEKFCNFLYTGRAK